MAFVNALQYIINRGLNPEKAAGLPRVILDVNGYREKREDKLAELAVRLAEEAKESGEDRVLEPLDPRERRVVHLTLAEEEGVKTHSLGEGFYKNVVISAQGEGEEETAESPDPA